MKRSVFPNRWLPYALVGPQVIITLVFFFWPAFDSLRLSLYRASPFGDRLIYAGLANFHYIFGDSLFITAIENNLTLFFCVPIMVVLSVILAALLFDRPRGWKIYRTLLFLPYILSIPVVGVVFSYLFTYNGSANET